MNYLAIDLGAGSGRIIIASYDGNSFDLDVVHRFPTPTVTDPDTGLHWDFEIIWREILNGLKLASEKTGGDIKSIGVDTWGVDYALLNGDDELIGNPFHYRNTRNDTMVEEMCKRVPREEIFQHTGIQFMQINTAPQLVAAAINNEFAGAKTFFMIPDLVNFKLTGKKFNERTDASTSQLYDPANRRWATELIEKLGIPTDIFLDFIDAGQELGPLLPEVAEFTGLKDVPVIAVGAHDTASAVAAVPLEAGKTFAYISSGTWSLMGIEAREPSITPQMLDFNFTNEIGVNDTVRILKNLTGTWLIQECKRIWNESGDNIDYAEMAELAGKADPLTAFINPDAHDFMAPSNMPEAVQDFCRKTGQPVPQDKGAILRCINDSLAFRYRWAFDILEKIAGETIDVLHIVGGGIQNRLLNQSAANAVNRPVLTGPVEATAMGNILMQMYGVGEVKSLAEGRELMRQSFPPEEFTPEDTQSWDEAYPRFEEVLED